MNVNGENIEFWNKVSKRYDWITLRLIKDYPNLIQRISNDIADKESVLEVGTGSGLIALEPTKKTGMVEAIDYAPKMIEFAKNKAAENQVKNIHFSVQSAYSLEFDNGKFDVVVCSNVLHCMKSPECALSEIRRVLKPNGILIAPTFCHGVNWRSRLVSKTMSLTGFKSYQKYKTEDFFSFIIKSGFAIVNKDISKDFIPLAYVVARSETVSK